MHIGPITHANPHALANTHAGGRPEVPKAQASTAPSVSDEQPDQVPRDSETDDAKGVLRLLEQGRFRGVADVRLRINFHEQIQAADSLAQKQANSQSVTDLTIAVDTQLDEIIANSDLTEQQLAELDDTKNTFDQAVSEAQQNSSQLTQDIQSAFDTFFQALSSLLSPEPDPSSEIDVTQNLNAGTVTEENPEAHEPETAEPTPLEALQAAFTAALQTLQDSLDATYTMLPQLSPPNGNGSAYDKFLTIYNELYGLLDSPGSDSESQTSIDVEA